MAEQSLKAEINEETRERQALAEEGKAPGREESCFGREQQRRIVNKNQGVFKV
jgi:hypothetical protein